MNIQIVGLKKTEFTTKDGTLISGQSVYFTFEDDRTKGLQTDKCFLPSRKALYPEPNLPADAEIYYNRYGKVDAVVLS